MHLKRAEATKKIRRHSDQARAMERDQSRAAVVAGEDVP